MAVAGDTVAGFLNRLWYSQHPAVRLLWPVSAMFGLLARVRRGLYAAGLPRPLRVSACVVVIGNISVGGTGKTPIVIWLAQMLRARKLKVGIVCRGYGGTASRVPQFVSDTSDPAVAGDEAVMLARQLNCPIVTCRDRVAAARLLVAQHQVDVVLSDDGLQHFRLARDFEIAAVDGTRGLGNGFCLPVGPLREPPGRLAEVDAVIVNDGEWASEGALRASMVAVEALELATGRRRPLAAFRGEVVQAAAAIGNPERFFSLLENCGIVVTRHAFRDHAPLPPAAFELARNAPMLITEKDAVKCPRNVTSNVWVVPARITFEDQAGADRLIDLIADAVHRENQCE